jgi:hypothetical protein
VETEVETRAKAMSNAETGKLRNKEQQMSVAVKVTAATEAKATGMSAVETGKLKSKEQELNVAGKVAAPTEARMMKKTWEVKKEEKADKVPVTREITKAGIPALVECNFS